MLNFFIKTSLNYQISKILIMSILDSLYTQSMMNQKIWFFNNCQKFSRVAGCFF
ncbi:hypothetical protein NTGBS_470055 [Candidatus Nitrotoga sp. BS]|nr:hypothetical protein NTGBS_470055 [Candidatus Nitrotoga sp. BS]